MYSSFWPSGFRSGRISVTSILDDAFNILRRSFALVVAASALLIVPVTLLSTFLTARVAPNVNAHAQRVVDLSNDMQDGHTIAVSTWTNAVIAVVKDYLKILAVAGGLGLAQACLLGCALGAAVSLLCLGRETTVAACYRFAARRFVKAVSATLAAVAFLVLCAGVPALLGVLTGSTGLTALLVLGSLIVVAVLGVRMSLLVQVVTVEGRGLSALARSFALTKGYFWKVIGLTLLTTFMVFLMVNLTDTIVMHATNNALVDTLVNVTITTLTSPLVLCAQMLLYMQLRIAKEGFGPEALAEEMRAV